MSEQTATNRFIVPPFEKHFGFYQQLLKGVSDYKQLGQKLVTLAQHARAVKRFDNLSERALMLINLPIKNYQTIGQYFWALCLYQKGPHNIEKARTLLEQVACVAPLKYRAEAMLSLSGLAWLNDKPEETIKYCMEAGRLGEIDTTLEAFRGVAVLKSRLGDHKTAMHDLENLHPLMKHASSPVYFDYLNSYAVELTEVGRLQEAENVSRLVVASPFSSYYPDWKETFEDIRKHRKSRSTVSIGEPKPLPTPQQATTNVIQFPSGERISSDESISDLPMSALQALAMVIRSVAKGALTETQIEKICDGFQFALELLFTDEE